MGQVGFLFPGQGAQKAGMGRDLSDAIPACRDVYDRAGAVLGMDLAAVCFDGPPSDLDRTAVSQPALLATSVAMLRAMEERCPGFVAACRAAAGLSLGEYTALVMAGAIEFEDAVRLVRERGRFMEQACDERPGGMASFLGLDGHAVEDICREAADAGEIVPANFNCPGQVVVSGEQAAVDKASRLARERGARKVVALQVSGAFHSPLMQPAADRLAPLLEGLAIRAPRFPVVANVSGQALTEPDSIRAALLKQVAHPVVWQPSMEGLLADGFDTFYEVGPAKVLASLMKRIDRNATVYNINSLEALSRLAG